MLSVMLAVALQSTTTNCSPTGLGNVQCETRQNPGIDWGAAPQPYDAMQGMRAFQMGRQMRQQEQAEQRAYEPAERPPVQEQSDTEAVRSIFIQVLAERMDFHMRHGRCRESYTLATYALEYSMAARSREMCPF